MNRSIPLLILAALLTIIPRAAAQFVWTGLASDGFAGSSANWTPSTPPGTGTANVAFGDFVGPQVNVQMPAFALNNIDFNGTSRPTLTFSGFGGPEILALNGNVAMTSGNSVTFQVSLDISLSNTTHVVDIAGISSLLSVQGNVSGLGAITKLGAGTLTLSGTNTYSGGTTVRFGTLAIDGGSISHPGSDTLIGLSSGDSGTLSLLNGGDLTDRIGQIGFTGNTGTVTVAGIGSTWTNTNYLYVGLAGTGGLSVSNGGAVVSLNTSIGNNSGGIGQITLQNSGSSLTNTDTLYVGSQGSGILQIQSGASATNVTGVVANNAGGSGAVLVNGIGSAWINSGPLYVGGTGNGSLMVGAGGSVSDTLGWLGTNAGSTGIATISGTGSTWTNSTGLTVGNSGSGTLFVLGGGILNVAGGSGTVTLGATSAGTGALLIGAADSGGVINAANIATGSGGGFVSLATNATSASPYYLTKDGTSSGPAVTITGPTLVTNVSGYNVLSGANSYTGGTIISGGTLVASGFSSPLGFGPGTVTVANGATLAVDNAFLGNPVTFASGSRLIGNGGFFNATIGAGVTLAPGLPGAPIGQLFFEDLTLGGLGTLELNIKFNGEGFNFDSVDVQNSETLTILATSGSPFTLKLISLDASGAPGTLSGGILSGNTYPLNFLSTNGVSGDFLLGSNFLVDATNFQTGLSGVTFGLTRTGNDFTLNFTPVPEPSTWALLGCGVACVAGTAWRRRRGDKRGSVPR